MIAISQDSPMNLEKQLSAAIVRHPHLYQRRVLFRADNGHVVLQGRVRSFFEKQLAQEALRSIKGVTSIDNQLEVSWTERGIDA